MPRMLSLPCILHFSQPTQSCRGGSSEVGHHGLMRKAAKTPEPQPSTPSITPGTAISCGMDQATKIGSGRPAFGSSHTCKSLLPSLPRAMPSCLSGLSGNGVQPRSLLSLGPSSQCQHDGPPPPPTMRRVMLWNATVSCCLSSLLCAALSWRHSRASSKGAGQAADSAGLATRDDIWGKKEGGKMVVVLRCSGHGGGRAWMRGWLSPTAAAGSCPCLPRGEPPGRPDSLLPCTTPLHPPARGCGRPAGAGLCCTPWTSAHRWPAQARAHANSSFRLQQISLGAGGWFIRSARALHACMQACWGIGWAGVVERKSSLWSLGVATSGGRACPACGHFGMGTTHLGHRAQHEEHGEVEVLHVGLGRGRSEARLEEGQVGAPGACRGCGRGCFIR